MKQIILVRHGQAQNNLHNLIGGWSDVNLTEFGIKQAQAVAQRLDDELQGTYKIISSDLTRAKQTTEIISKQLNTAPSYAIELREHNPGIVSGMPFEEAMKHLHNVPVRTPDHRPWTGSESWREFYERVTAYMNRLFDSEEHVIIISHGGTIRNIIGWWIHLPLDMLLQEVFRVSNASITILDINSISNQRRIERLNDTNHYSRINKSNPIPYP
jgi:broad specificity phosphatase PhoE